MLASLALLAVLSAPFPDTLSHAPAAADPSAAAAFEAARWTGLPSATTSDPADPADPGPADQIVEYSDGYGTRLKIHRWASYLTVPLFVGQYVVGQKLIDGDGSSGLRSLHGALAGGVAGLFVVNTVTGGWNAIEAWKDPEDRTRRTLHTVLMLLADAGFVATGALANENEHAGPGERADNSSHRAMAIASMGTALVGYSIMLPIFRRD
ncbi:MAG: hypothetical protein R3E98_03945 [Gemmatimonadota bacterium]